MTIDLPAASGVLVNYAGCLTVHSTRETSGTAAAVYRLWDGSTNEGTLLLPVSLAISESTRDDFYNHHIVFRTGLYYELVSGTIEGSVSVLVDHDCNEILEVLLHEIAGQA